MPTEKQTWNPGSGYNFSPDRKADDYQLRRLAVLVASGIPELKNIAAATEILERATGSGRRRRAFEAIREAALAAKSWDEFVTATGFEVLAGCTREAVGLAKKWRAPVTIESALNITGVRYADGTTSCPGRSACGRPYVEDGAEFGPEYDAVELVFHSHDVSWKEVEGTPDWGEVTPSGNPKYGFEYAPTGSVWVPVVGPIMKAAAAAEAVNVTYKGTWLAMSDAARAAVVLESSLSNGYSTVANGRAPGSRIVFYSKEVKVSGSSGSAHRFGRDCVRTANE
jgi:hypothetical protein